MYRISIFLVICIYIYYIWHSDSWMKSALQMESIIIIIIFNMYKMV